MVKDNSNNTEGKKELVARLAKSGLKDFGDENIIELLLYYSGYRRNVRETAESLIKRFGSAMDIICADKQLLSSAGLNESAVVLARLIYEIYPCYAEAALERRKFVLDTEELKKMFRIRFIGRRTEELHVICFDSALSVISEHCVSRGIASFTEVDTNRLASLLLEKNASAAAIGHNHPNSGSLPSAEDIAFTNRAARLMKNLGITFLDHIITGERSSYSFRENGGISIFL